MNWTAWFLSFPSTGVLTEDESDVKISSIPASERCPKGSRIPGAISTQHQMLSFIEQGMDKARSSILHNKIWFCIAPLGKTMPGSMMKEVLKWAGIEPHLTKSLPQSPVHLSHSNHNCESRHIKYIIGHQSDQAFESYNQRPLMEQLQLVSQIPSQSCPYHVVMPFWHWGVTSLCGCFWSLNQKLIIAIVAPWSVINMSDSQNRLGNCEAGVKSVNHE